jgi:hypothetical protein
MVICHLWKSTVNDNENWLLFSKIVPEGVFWSLGLTEILFLVRGNKKVEPPWFKSFSSLFLIDLQVN